MSNSGSTVVGRYGMEIGQLEFVGEPIVFRGWPDTMNLIEIDDRMRVAVLHLDATYRVCNSRFSDTDRSVEEDAVNHPTRLSQPLRRTETGPVPEAPFPTIRPRWSRHHGLRPASCDPRPATRDLRPATRDLRPAETFFYRNSARKRIPEPLENLTSRNWVSRAISTNAHDLCDRIEAAFAAFAKYAASSARSRAESDQFLFASPSNGGPVPKTRSVLREGSRSMHAQMPSPCL